MESVQVEQVLVSWLVALCTSVDKYQLCKIWWIVFCKLPPLINDFEKPQGISTWNFSRVHKGGASPLPTYFQPPSPWLRGRRPKGKRGRPRRSRPSFLSAAFAVGGPTLMNFQLNRCVIMDMITIMPIQKIWRSATISSPIWWDCGKGKDAMSLRIYIWTTKTNFIVTRQERNCWNRC